MKVSKTAVIDAASQIADEHGLHNVSLKVIAEKLCIKTPSLYNHIDNLDSLLREVAHKGMRTINERLERVAIGKSGDVALKAVGIEYLNFMIEHPGIYETIQWATWNGTSETAEIYENYTSLLKTLIRSCKLQEKYVDEILDIFAGIFHGYTTLQLRYAFDNPNQVRERLSNTLDTILRGIYQRYK